MTGAIRVSRLEWGWRPLLASELRAPDDSGVPIGGTAQSNLDYAQGRCNSDCDFNYCTTGKLRLRGSARSWLNQYEQGQGSGGRAGFSREASDNNSAQEKNRKANGAEANPGPAQDWSITLANRLPQPREPSLQASLARGPTEFRSTLNCVRR
jgi:hypothetical protein